MGGGSSDGDRFHSLRQGLHVGYRMMISESTVQEDAIASCLLGLCEGNVDVVRSTNCSSGL